MATITAKSKINGWVLGAHFKDGSAESEVPATLAAFRKLDGYKVVAEPAAISLDKPADPEEGDGGA